MVWGLMGRDWIGLDGIYYDETGWRIIGWDAEIDVHQAHDRAVHALSQRLVWGGVGRGGVG